MFDNRCSSQHDLPRIRLYHCFFDYNIEFKLSGLMSLIRCEFKGHSLKGVQFYFEKGQYEPEITEESLEKFNSKEYENRIEIIQTRINFGHIDIHIDIVARHLKMENVDLSVEYGVRIFSGMKVQDIQTVSVFELDVINCRVFAIIGLHLTVELLVNNRISFV